MHLDHIQPAPRTTSARPKARRRITAVARGTAALALASAVAVSLSAPAAHAEPAERPTVTVAFHTGGVARVTVPNKVRPGALRFRVTDGDVAPHGVTVFSLQPGATLAKVSADIAADGSPDPGTASAATRALIAEAHFVGGVDINPGSTLTSTSERLAAGTYYAVDPTPTFSGGAVALLQTFTVAGKLREGDEADAAARVTMTAADRFQFSGHVPARGRIVVDNDANTIHFMDLVPVVPGTTDAQLQKFFDSFGPTGPTLPDPEIGPPVAGESALSPGTQAVLGLDVPAGDYALECFIADDTTGMPHAFMGMHLIVHVG